MLSTTNWHLPSTSERIKSHVAAVADLQHPLKVAGWLSGMRHFVLEKNWQNRLQIVRLCSGTHFMSPILASPHI